MWKDRDRFKKFAQSSLELCKVYMEISVSTGSCRELLTAEMHLKNTIKQARYLVFQKKLTLSIIISVPIFIYLLSCIIQIFSITSNFIYSDFYAIHILTK